MAVAAAWVCDLCGAAAAAAVYCDADGAFLCWPCDAAVHGANFLVARHVRRLACASCRAADSGRRLSGPGAPRPPPIRALCPSCRPADPPPPPPPPPAPPSPPPPMPTTTSSAPAPASSSSRVPAAARASRIGVALDGSALSCAAKLRGGARARARSRARTGVAKAEEGWGESAA